MPASPQNFYETDQALSEYLLFHYGSERDLLLNGSGPREALDFARRCAELALRHPVSHGRSLDLGCAVGRSACELSGCFQEAIGLDYSHALIAAAQAVVREGSVTIQAIDEGEITRPITLHRPAATRPERLRFVQGDAMALSPDLGTFDFVLMANLIDRLPDPARCLRRIGEIVRPAGILAITSPYTWLETYTPKANWLGGYYRDGVPQRSYQALQALLAPEFAELEALDMPFLIREHARKSQYSVAHATLWRKRS